MANYSLLRLGFISEPEKQALYAAGVRSTARLIVCAKTPECLKSLSDKLSISEQKLKLFAEKLDIMRINGIGEDYCLLLADAGIHTLTALAAADPVVLMRALREINARDKKVRQLPNVQRVMRWVEDAKTLPPLA